MNRSRTLVIGDLHGCLAHLDRLLDALALSSGDQLVFLGDLVDRGPDSAGVIRRVIGLAAHHPVSIIMGNHEEMMLAARDSHDKLADWVLNGGDQTLRSYAGARGTIRDVPGEHWHFLESQLVAYVETATHLLVHASVEPDLEMADQADYMLRWQRFDGIRPHESGKIIVCGHTPQKSGKPANKGFAICLDTSACRGGPLTCLDIESGRIWLSKASGPIQKAHITDFADE